MPRFTSSVAPRPTLLERPQAMLTAAVLGAVPDEFGGVAPAVNKSVARVAGLLATAALPALLGAAASESRAGAPVTSFEAEEGEKAEAQTTFGNTTVAVCYPHQRAAAHLRLLRVR
ncbi:MAG: hypothetical protein ACJ8J0_19840 [Longimicrobiaceae bacterium]